MAILLPGLLCGLGPKKPGPVGAVPIDGPGLASADAFLDSMGIAAHWDRKDSVYRHAKELTAAIVALGVRHVRGYDPAISETLARSGIVSMLPAGPEVGDPQTVLRTVRQANANHRVIDAVEGPNEADLFWPMHGYSYKGEGFPAGVIAYQRDMAAAFAHAPDQAGVLLIGPSLGKTYDPGAGKPNPFAGGSLSKAVDEGNFHPYPFGGNPFSPAFSYDGIARYIAQGNFPSINIGEFPYALAIYAPPFAPRPMAATETGYPTWYRGVSETVQARYLPRLFAEYFRLGIRRTYLYELADYQPDPSGGIMDDHFGLLHADLSPKPAFMALQSLIALLRPAVSTTIGGAAPAVSLSVHMPPGFDRTGDVHSLLLRASSDKSLLLLWHEVSNADVSVTPPRSFSVPDGSVEVGVAPPYRAAFWYGFGTDWQLQRHTPPPQGLSAWQVPLQDRIVVVSIERSGERGL